MKTKIVSNKLFNLFFLSLFLIQLSILYTKAQTAKIYMTVVSHNEDEQPFNTDKSYYLQQRDMTIKLAKLFNSYGVKWNLQTDWTLLNGIELYEKGKLLNKTNKKHLLRWLYEDMKVQIDPHCQEAEGDYLYADIAQWIEKLGVPVSGVVGGFLYDTTGIFVLINNTSSGNYDWTIHQQGTYSQDGQYFYKPDYLWGASSAFHTGTEDETYGIWIPKDFANFYTHDSTQSLAFIGHGCKNTITDNAINLDNLFNLLDSLNSGILPEDGYYTSSLILHQDYFESTNYYSQVKDALDMIKNYDTKSRVEWMNLTDVGDNWRVNYNSQPYQLDCDEIRSLQGGTSFTSEIIDDIVISDSKIKISPNPVQNILNINTNYNDVSINIYSSNASLVATQKLDGQHSTVNTENLKSGIYFIRIFSDKKFVANARFIKN